MIGHSAPRLVFLTFHALTFLERPTMSLSSAPNISDHEELALRELIPSDYVVTLTLQEAVMQALEHNLDIQVSRYSRNIRLTDFVFQGTDPDHFDQNETNFSLGLMQKLLTGGAYDLAFNTDGILWSEQTSFLFNPAYTRKFVFNLTQPLLRGFGPTINKVQITLARNATDVEQLTLVNQVLLVIAQVGQAYWELVFARENLKVARATLQAVEELLTANRAKVKAGVMADVEAFQAQAGWPTDLMQTISLVPLGPPVQHSQETPLQENLQSAFERRPEILQAKKILMLSASTPALPKPATPRSLVSRNYQSQRIR
jgi:outer membrane protein